MSEDVMYKIRLKLVQRLIELPENSAQNWLVFNCL